MTALTTQINNVMRSMSGDKLHSMTTVRGAVKALEREHVEAKARIAALELLLARNLVMDRGSAEEGAEALGGIYPAIDLVEAYREANPLPGAGGDDDVF